MVSCNYGKLDILIVGNPSEEFIYEAYRVDSGIRKGYERLFRENGVNILARRLDLSQVDMVNITGRGFLEKGSGEYLLDGYLHWLKHWEIETSRVQCGLDLLCDAFDAGRSELGEVGLETLKK